MQSSLYHNFSGMHNYDFLIYSHHIYDSYFYLYTEEGEDYSDQSYDVSSEDSYSYEVASDNIEEISATSHIPDEQRSRILTMAEIFKTMFQGGQTSSTTPLPKLNTTGN